VTHSGARASTHVASELSPIFGDGLLVQAAAVVPRVAPLGGDVKPMNFTAKISFGNWLWPSRRRQHPCPASTGLKTNARAVRFDRQPFEWIVRFRTLLAALWRRADRHQNALLLVFKPGLADRSRRGQTYT